MLSNFESDMLLASMLSKAIAVNGRQVGFTLKVGQKDISLYAIAKNGMRVDIGNESNLKIRRAIKTLVEKYSRVNYRTAYLNDSGECNLKKPLFNIMFTMPDLVARLGHPFSMSSTPTAEGLTVDVLISIRYSEEYWTKVESNIKHMMEGFDPSASLYKANNLGFSHDYTRN
jgi:hypothetical protein